MANFQDIQLTTSDHDLLIENFDLQLINGIDRVVQNLRIALWIILGEWSFDTTLGLDYFGTFAEKNPDLGRVESDIKRRILGVQDVLEILSFSSEFNISQRRLTVDFQVNTTFGQSDTITI